MAAQTAGLCVLSICIVLAWFQSNALGGQDCLMIGALSYSICLSVDIVWCSVI